MSALLQAALKTLDEAVQAIRAALAEPQRNQDFYAWYATQSKYVEPADIVPWMHEAWNAALAQQPQPEPAAQNDWMWEDCGTALESMTCPWCDRQGTDICQHADDAKNCEKTK